MLVECTILSLNILINYPFGVYLPFFLPRLCLLYIPSGEVIGYLISIS